MPENNDEDDANWLTNVQLPDWLKSRTIKAIDQLIGAGVEVGEAYFSGLANKIRAKNQRDIDFDNAINEKTIDRALETSGFIEKAMAAHELRVARFQFNRERIARKAVEYIEESGFDEAHEGESLNLDWMDKFGDYAEKVTAEDIQSLWAQILADEIRRPGAYSLITLRHMAEMDKRLADLFSRNIDHEFGGSLIRSPNNEDGNLNPELLELQTAGFLQGVTGGLTKNIVLTEETYNTWNYESWSLLAYPKLGMKKVKLPSIMLTRPARELIGVLTRKDGVSMAQYLRDFCSGEIEHILVFNSSDGPNFSRNDIIKRIDF